MSRQALGRGLRSLIPQMDEISGDKQGVSHIQLNLITANPFQPRKEFDEEKLQQLADSIKQHGVLEPIIVRRYNGGYQIVAGERRWRACSLAGLESIPAIVKDLTDKEMTEIALIENLQREDLNAIEEAEGYRLLLEEFNLTQEEVAEAVGKKRSSITNALRLLNLDQQVKSLVSSGQLSKGHAKVLLSIEDVAERQHLAKRVIKEEMSVRQLEKIIKGKSKKPKPTKREQNPEVKVLQEELQRVLGTKVRLDYHQGKGKIEIEYYSDEELERILDFMRG
ncbi:MAG: ParB/RepB/Spo0J family partition protein [Firmicutes bacterium]|nr:ParB/RepB/Spo0J family partition protein [Bacillota bacterium]